MLAAVVASVRALVLSKAIGCVTTVPTCNSKLPVTGPTTVALGVKVTCCSALLTSVVAEGLRYCSRFDWFSPWVFGPKLTTNVCGLSTLTVAWVASLPAKPVVGLAATGVKLFNQVWICWAATVGSASS